MPIIVQNQFYIIGLIPEKFDQHSDRALGVQLLLYQLLDGVVQLLHGNLHAMCHFQLILDASRRHRCVKHPLNNRKLLDRELLLG